MTASAFSIGDRVLGTGVWNFNADRVFDRMTFKGSAGELRTPVFGDTDVIVTRGSDEGDAAVHAVRNPPHVHQPLIQAIVDELRGGAPSPSTGESAARTAWVMDRCVASYYEGGG